MKQRETGRVSCTRSTAIDGDSTGTTPGQQRGRSSKETKLQKLVAVWQKKSIDHRWSSMQRTHEQQRRRERKTRAEERRSEQNQNEGDAVERKTQADDKHKM
jgi:hypothetical protein